MIKKIKTIADELAKNGSTFSRADLAFELKMTDSVEVEKLVWNAYTNYYNDKNIANAFIANDGSMTVVDSYKVAASLAVDDTNKTFLIVKNDLKNAEQELHNLQNQIDATLQMKIMATASSVSDFLSGTSGVKNAQQEAAAVFKNYSNLVDYYIQAKSCIRNDVADFTDLRTDITMRFQKYSLALVDIFGDSIKVVDPQLFNFDSIQFLDAAAMLKQAELDYNVIAEKCPVLISEISDSFRTSFSNAISTFKATKAQSTSVGLVLAGIQLFSHYADASKKTSVLNTELSNLKMSVKRDVTQIKGDLARLLVIHKTLNDLYIPKAHTFYRYFDRVMSAEIQRLIDSIYSSPKAKELKAKRDGIFEICEKLLFEINDHKESIALYESLIKDIESQLDAQSGNYRKAKADKPVKPMICIGPAKDKYYRALSNWDEFNAPMIKNYDNMQVELKLNRDELAAHRRQLEIVEREYKTNVFELKKISRQIIESVSVSDNVKKEMLKHLKPIVGLLNIAKEIAQSKLDDRLVSTVGIRNANEVELPVQLEQNLNHFASEVAKSLNIRNLEYDLGMKQGSLEAYSAQYDAAVQKGLEAFQSYTRLKMQRAQEKITSAFYDNELSRIQNEFMGMVKSIDKKSNVLYDIFANINTAESPEKLKEALLELSDNQINISERDFELFLQGKKQIEI